MVDKQRLIPQPLGDAHGMCPDKYIIAQHLFKCRNGVVIELAVRDSCFFGVAVRRPEPVGILIFGHNAETPRLHLRQPEPVNKGFCHSRYVVKINIVIVRRIDVHAEGAVCIGIGGILKRNTSELEMRLCAERKHTLAVVEQC